VNDAINAHLRHVFYAKGFEQLKIAIEPFVRSLKELDYLTPKTNKVRQPV
jgi:hypothetical protein